MEAAIFYSEAGLQEDVNLRGLPASQVRLPPPSKWERSAYLLGMKQLEGFWLGSSLLRGQRVPAFTEHLLSAGHVHTPFDRGLDPTSMGGKDD